MKKIHLEKILKEFPFFFLLIGKEVFLKFCLKVSKSLSQTLDKIWLN